MSASAAQCCFNPDILVSVATQTDDVPTTITPSIGINVSSAVDYQDPIAAEQWKMSHEHNYSMPYPEIYPTFGFDDSSNVASLDPLTKVEVDHVPPVEISLRLIMMTSMMMTTRTPTGNYPRMKNPYPLMGTSQRVR